MENKLKNIIKDALKNLDIDVENISLEHPDDLSHGDYSTNVAMMYAKKLGKNPRELAENIVSEILKNKPKEIAKVDLAGPGFINFYLSQEFFVENIKEIKKAGIDWGRNNLSLNKKILVEYTDPNPFKPFHIGHLMTNAIGESVARVFEYSGANVIRANYQGDVGLHVAKAIYGMQSMSENELKNKMLSDDSSSELAAWIGKCYSDGSNAYDSDPEIKVQIDELNKEIYKKENKEINQIYDWGRKVTLEAFEEIYKKLGTKFVHYFFESEMAPIGEKIVKENIGKVFEESDGAVVFKGEKYNSKLHTRVFITKQGLPTYETKEIGLTVTKFLKENPDVSIVVTAIEQGPYMEVVQKALSLIHPDYESRMKHITHGMMRFASGKMSSRKGNIITGESLLSDTKDAVFEKISDRGFSENEKENISSQISVASIKYSILKQALGGNIIYDQENAISFEGDSGPYLQYTVVRANSVLEKAKEAGFETKEEISLGEVWQTTNLEKYLYRFPEVVEWAYKNLEPHFIATYLIELSSEFNTFYSKEKIIDQSDQKTTLYKLALTESFVLTMQNGLYLLGISVPEKM